MDREAKAEADIAELQSREAALAQRQAEVAAQLEAAASRDKAHAAEKVGLRNGRLGRWEERGRRSNSMRMAHATEHVGVINGEGGQG
eukprot:scaffold269412_cov17-Tisochrysis_lutea.AAC.1